MTRSGGGFPAIRYVLSAAAGTGVRDVAASLASRNVCKTCALGMGGQAGGATNEAGRRPEFCKKSVQAIAGDLRPAVDTGLLREVGIEGMERMSPRELEHLGRLTVPLLAEPESRAYRPLGWEEAMARVADQWRRTERDRAFLYASGRSSNEAGFLLQLFGRGWGTNNVTNCSYYCHQASAVGLGDVVGQGTGTLALEDLDSCDLVVLVGGNPASNHPRLMRSLVEVRRRGGRVVVVNPLVEPGLVMFRVPSDPASLLGGSRIADLYVRPHAGGDPYLLAAVMALLLERGAVDRGYLAAYTRGWEEVEADLARQDVDALCRAAGVSRTRAERFAGLLGESRATVIAWTMGVTHHTHGSDTVRLLATLALMRGMVGRPGGGLLPLRGHSNVQGMGTVGVSPQLKPVVLERLAERLGVTAPPSAGLDTLSGLELAHAGGIDTALCLGGNLFGASPESSWTKEALGRVSQVAYLSTSLNTGHVHGRGVETIVLPVRARDEESQATTQESMFSFVRMSDGGPCRHAGFDDNGAATGPRGEVEVLADLATRVLGRQPVDWSAWSDHSAVRRAIAEVVPGLEGLADIDATRREFTVPGRRIGHEKADSLRFATPDGRARLRPVPLPPVRQLDADQLRLVTLRSEGQFNGVVYEEADLYRGQTRRDVVLMHRSDLARLSVADCDRVVVSSRVGQIEVTAAAYEVRPGTCAMYYPEANVLVPRDVDPESRTPAFKNVTVSVRPA